MNIRLLITALFMVSFWISCVQETADKSAITDWRNDGQNYYKEYPDEDVLTDSDVVEDLWDVRFSFLGVINDGTTPAENMQLGSGALTYLNLEKNNVTINSSLWAIKKSIKISSGHEVPIIQIFFADDTANVSPEGTITYYILQLEGSSIAKSETYYLNNDKIFKADVTLEDGKIKRICYIQEPYSNKGSVTIFTHNIRVGEELRIEGKADMFDMEIVECKTLE
ncbi:MAG TPA: hypothetical protein PLZ43_13910 [bacterium]|nr:hypothetical protein [bacterium]